MKKLYSIKDSGSDTCEEIEYFKEMLDEDDHRNSYELEEWKPNIPGDGTFWCKVEGECFGNSEGICGSKCYSYKPRNGKSGRCRFHSHTYSPTGRMIKIEK